jgi:hypothetical protein
MHFLWWIHCFSWLSNHKFNGHVIKNCDNLLTGSGIFYVFFLNFVLNFIWWRLYNLLKFGFLYRFLKSSNMGYLMRFIYLKSMLMKAPNKPNFVLKYAQHIQHSNSSLNCESQFLHSIPKSYKISYSNKSWHQICMHEILI